MAERRDLQLGLRRRASWWLGILAVFAGVLAFSLFMKWRRPPGSASRETTTTGAELESGGKSDLPGGAGPACESHAACAKGALCTRGRCAPITSRTTECRQVMVRFARGTSTLSSAAENEVERATRCFEANREPTVVIEPSSDPTGSREQNEALTKARVSTVRNAIEQRGVAPERLVR
jgi:outer membrane protein OmpA-like peptidoglycan-associated protein